MVVSAPVPIVLFGDQQDSLNLPMITVATSHRISIHTTPRDDRIFRLHFRDSDDSLEIDPKYPRTNPTLFERTTTLLTRSGANGLCGLDISIDRDPTQGDTGLISATLSAWIRTLMYHSSNQIRPNSKDIFRLFESSQKSHSQIALTLTSLSGGMLWIEFSPRLRVARIEATVPSMLVAETGRGRLSPDIAARNRAETLESLARIAEKIDGFDISQTPIALVEHRLQAVAPDPARRLTAHLINRNITREARESLLAGDRVKLGHLLTLHHYQLRDGLDYHDEPVERLLHAAIENGGLGGKIIPPGGQCIIFTPEDKVLAIQKVLESMGATAEQVTIDRGARKDGAYEHHAA